MDDVLYMINVIYCVGYILVGGYFAVFRKRYDIAAYCIAFAILFKVINISLEINP